MISGYKICGLELRYIYKLIVWTVLWTNYAIWVQFKELTVQLLLDKKYGNSLYF